MNMKAFHSRSVNCGIFRDCPPSLRYLFLVVALMTWDDSSAQKSYFSFEGGVTKDIFDFQDSGGGITKIVSPQAVFGPRFRHVFKDRYFMQIAVLKKVYNFDYRFNPPARVEGGTSIYALIVPAEIGLNLNLFNRKLFIVPSVGYSFCTNIDYNDMGGIYEVDLRSRGKDVVFQHNESTDLPHFYSLIQAGLAAEYHFGKNFIASIMVNRYTGFNQILRYDVDYAAYGNVGRATATAKGAFVSLGGSVKYMISALWQE